MTNFERDYKKAQKYSNKSKVTYIQHYIQDILLPYINGIKSQNPNSSIQEIDELIHKDSFDFAKTVFDSTHTFNLYMQYTSCRYLQSHPKKFEEIYKKLRSGELTVDNLKANLHTDNSFEDYLIQYVNSSAKSFDKTYKTCQDFFAGHPKLKAMLDEPKLKTADKLNKAQTYFGKVLSSGYDRKKYMHIANYYLKGISYYLIRDEQILLDVLKDNLTTSISSIAQQLQKLNLFDKYSEKELFHFKKMNFEEFITKNKHTDITNPQLLNNLSVQELIILNSFWLNRYAKELERHAESLFTIKTLDLLPKILDGSFHISDINKDTLKHTLMKCKIIRDYAQSFINKKQIDYFKGLLKPDEYTVDESNNFITYSFKDFGKDMRRRYPTEYLRAFNDVLPTAENKIESDARLYCNLICPVVNIYDLKNEMLHSILCTLDKNGDIVNAGIIPDSISDDGTKITLNPNFVCIGIDSKFTFPVREHTKLPVLQDFMVSYGNNYVPVYVGIRDFTFPNGEIISAQQVLPFTKEEQKFIKKYMPKIPEEQQSDFILHLNWLRDPSAVPQKYLSPIVDSKGRSKKAFVKTYINLANYQPGKPLPVYTLQDEKYVPISQTNIQLSQSDVLDKDDIINGGEYLEF